MPWLVLTITFDAASANSPAAMRARSMESGVCARAPSNRLSLYSSLADNAGVGVGSVTLAQATPRGHKRVPGRPVNAD